MSTLTWETEVPHPPSAVFDWYESTGSFDRLMPPWEVSEVVRADNTLEDGAQRVFRFPLGPIKMTWVAEHLNYDPPNKFEDVMLKGPFRSWHHTHRFIATKTGTRQIDEVTYELPMWALGRLVAGRSIRKRLDRMFKARKLRMTRDMSRHADFSEKPRMKILVTGSSGLIGRELCAFLDTGKHEVWSLVRRQPRTEREIEWSPDEGRLDPSKIEGFDAVIHLAGYPVANKRWTRKVKDAIMDTRVKSTTLISDTIAGLSDPPSVFLCASAIGFYGNRGEEELDESSQLGEGYLADVSRKWEGCTKSASDAGIRTCLLRTGIVLSARGGALRKMLPAFKLGAGGPMASGKQWMSWISIDDEIYAIHHLMMSERCEGAHNLTAPEPVQNRTFTKNLGKVLRRPAFAPLPGFVMRLMFGERAGPLMIEGQRVMPQKLQESGYTFTHEVLEDALRDVLGHW